jgi:hypothetical protein
MRPWPFDEVGLPAAEHRHAARAVLGSRNLIAGGRKEIPERRSYDGGGGDDQ